MTSPMRCKHCKAPLHETVLGFWRNDHYVPHDELNCLIGRYEHLRLAIEVIAELSKEEKVVTYAKGLLEAHPKHAWSWDRSQNMEPSDT